MLIFAFVVSGILIALIAFHLGGIFNAASMLSVQKASRVVHEQTISHLHTCITKLLAFAETQTKLWQDVLAQKDTIIASLTDENCSLRTSLREIESFHDSMEDTEDDEEEEESVGVLAYEEPSKQISLDINKKTAVGTALEMYDRMEAAKDFLQSFKEDLPKGVYQTICQQLTLGDSNVDRNGSN